MASRMPTRSTHSRASELKASRGSRAWSAVGAALLVAVLAVLWSDRDSTDAGGDAGPLPSTDINLPHGNFDWVGPMATLEALVGVSDIIVVGRFVGFAETFDIAPAGHDPADQYLPDGQTATVTFTELVFEVDEYLKGTGPDTITVVQTGDLRRTKGYAEFPRPVWGVETMMFATQESYGERPFASVNGAFGRVVFSEERQQLEFPTALRPNVRYLEGKSFSELQAEVLGEVRSRATTSP